MCGRCEISARVRVPIQKVDLGTGGGGVVVGSLGHNARRQVKVGFWLISTYKSRLMGIAPHPARVELPPYLSLI